MATLTPGRVGMTTETAGEPTMTYEAAMREVLVSRQIEASLASTVKAARTRWEEEHADLLARTQAAALATVASEQQARALALREAEASGAKTLPYGVVIRERERLVYDAAVAVQVARDLAPHCLTLDTKAWEKQAKLILDGPNPGLIDAIVTVETVRTVALPNTERLAALLVDTPLAPPTPDRDAGPAGGEA